MAGIIEFDRRNSELSKDREQAQPLMFIDPPSPFAPISEWRDFLGEMKSIKPRSWEVESVRWAIAEAESELARRRASL